MRARERLRAWQAWVAGLTGWRRAALAFLLGVLATLALPPFHLVFLLIPSLTGLFWLIDDAATRRRVLLDGWWWGFGHFTTGLYWMCIALLTDPEKFAWLIPFTLIGLNAVIALYPGLAALLFWHLRPRGTLARVWLFSCLWVGVEFLRGVLFTGFPWNLAGYAWVFSDSVIQMASVIGIYGLTFVTVLAATLPAVAGGDRRARVALACVWGGFALCTLAGAWRLHQANQAPRAERLVEDVYLRIVQANIAQHHKWDPRLQGMALRLHIDLAQRQGVERVTHMIWPETAVPYALNKAHTLIRMLYPAMPDGGALITGTLRAEGEEDRDLKVWNSMAVIAEDTGDTAYYDKHHLVPFGEFVPLRRLLPIEKITPGGDDFSRGPGPQTIAVPGAPPMSPLICYEAIFPWEAVGGERPGWLLNITNDAWFGASTGPYQHFAMSRMRAVEQGLPLVRAANTGISAVVDAYGRVVESLPLNHQGVLDSTLPRAIPHATTYGRFGDIPLLLLVVFTCILTLFKVNKQIINN